MLTYVSFEPSPKALANALGLAFAARREIRKLRSSAIVITETSASRSPKTAMVIAGATETVMSGYFSVSSSGRRREGPFSTSLWALWISRSQIASA
jgi:hypothetical protein